MRRIRAAPLSARTDMWQGHTVFAASAGRVRVSRIGSREGPRNGFRESFAEDAVSVDTIGWQLDLCEAHEFALREP